MRAAGIGGGTGHTRRSFLGAVLAASATEALVAPWAAADEDESAAPSAPARAGTPAAAIAVAPDRTVWTVNPRISRITSYRGAELARSRSIEVGGRPVGIAISPEGDLALVTIADQDHPGLALVDLRGGGVDRIDVGPDPYSVAFAPDGRSAYVAGGGLDGTLTRVEPRSGDTSKPVALGRHPRGLAVDPDGEHAVVALGGDAAVAIVSLARRGGVRRIATAPYPHLVAIAPDGARALATHNGFGASKVTPVDLARRRSEQRVKVGADPSGVAFSDSGALALVAASKSRSVTILDGRSFGHRRTVRPGGVPRPIAVSGGRAVVADAGTGELTAFPLGAGR